MLLNSFRINKVWLWKWLTIHLMLKNLLKMRHYLSNLWKNIFGKKTNSLPVYQFGIQSLFVWIQFKIDWIVSWLPRPMIQTSTSNHPHASANLNLVLYWLSYPAAHVLIGRSGNRIENVERQVRSLQDQLERLEERRNTDFKLLEEKVSLLSNFFTSFVNYALIRRHDIQHNDNRYNDTEQNDIQNNNNKMRKSA